MQTEASMFPGNTDRVPEGSIATEGPEGPITKPPKIPQNDIAAKPADVKQSDGDKKPQEQQQ